MEGLERLLLLLLTIIVNPPPAMTLRYHVHTTPLA